MNEDYDFKFENVRQPGGSKICTLCCASILTKLSIEDLKTQFGWDLTLKGEVFWHLSRFRGAIASNRDGDTWSGIAFEFNGQKFDTADSVHSYNLKDQPAVCGVFSTSLRLPSGARAEHCVIYDPNIAMILDPAKAKPQKMSKYEFTYWEPLTKCLPYEGELF